MLGAIGDHGYKAIKLNIVIIYLKIVKTNKFLIIHMIYA
jgi:hypothetical protein